MLENVKGAGGGGAGRKVMDSNTSLPSMLTWEVTCICRDTGMCHYFGYFFWGAPGFLDTFWASPGFFGTFLG